MQNLDMLTKGVGKNEISEKGLFVWMMPHKRQGVYDLFNYSWDFMDGNIQIFHMIFFFVKGKKIVTKKSNTLHNY